MADEDDLPPRQLSEAPEQTEDGARSLGEMFGALVWLVAILAVVGGIFLLISHATH